MGLLRLLSYVLVFCFIGWVVSIFAVKVLAWVLSRLMPASIEFEVAGYNSLRDITLKFKKGSIKYVSVGEVKLTFGRSLIKKRSCSIYSHMKLQLLICDIYIVTTTSGQSDRKQKSRGSKSKGKGKLLRIMANIARFFSVSITDIVVKVPKADIDVKELKFDINKDVAANSFIDVYLYLAPLTIQMYTPESNFDQSSLYHQTDCLFVSKECSPTAGKSSAPIICEDVSIFCEFGHQRERLKVMALDFSTGDIKADLNEGLFFKTKPKSESSSGADVSEGAALDDSATKKPKKFPLESIKRNLLIIPEKVSLTMPKLDVTFTHRQHDFAIHNSILGVNLSSTGFSQADDKEEDASHFDVRLDFNEIHLLKGGEASILGILKLSFNTSIDAKQQPNNPIKVGTNIKIGGMHCNLIVNRLIPLLKLHSSGKKKMILGDKNASQERSQLSESKDILWTSAVSVPEFTIVTYSLNEVPICRASSQSTNISASNLSTMGIQVHAELSELLVVMENGYEVKVSQNLPGDEIRSGSVMNIRRLNISWGHKEMRSHERDDLRNSKLVLSVDVTGMGVFLSFQQIESLVSAMISYKSLLNGLWPSKKIATQNKMARSSKAPAKGTQIMKVNFDSCIIDLLGDMTVENTVVPDPKCVNYGSQGGQAIISVSSDGTPRTATVLSNLPSGFNHVKFKISVEIFRLGLCKNKENESTQIGLERARSIYQDFFKEEKLGAKFTLFDIHKTKFVQRSGGMHDSVRSLFSAADIAVRWEPDVHIALFELATRLKFLIQSKKFQDSNSEIKESSPVKDTVPNKANVDRVLSEKQLCKETTFAIDVENLRVSAELADGVQSVIHGRSIFSENAKIGVLLEEFILSFNEARVMKSGRMQISSVPIPTNNTTRDWVVQGLDIHVCLPYRLQLRAIDDAVEEMFRGLKLVTTALGTAIFSMKKDSTKTERSGSSKVGSLRVIIRRLVADIEEEPMQGWLDEHYYLIKNEVCELNARLKFLETVELLSTESSFSETTETTEPSDHQTEGELHYNGVEVNVNDTLSVQLLREEIHKKAFKSYYQACQKIVRSEGSGACYTGFQSGFKPSISRDSLLLISATDLDIIFTKIEGSNDGKFEFIKKMDTFCLGNDVPFSRFYGTDLLLDAGSLAVQLRDYTLPIFSGNSGKCKGRIVLAQQATCFQPQVQQDVFVGKWRRVRMFRSVGGTTPAMKTYIDLPISFDRGRISFGVGYEPVFADISYAFTVALRRANLGLRGSNTKLDVLTVTPPPKKERSLPWWDDMRYYIHGKIGLFFNTFEANVFATTDPYEKHDKLQFLSRDMNIQHTDGLVKVCTKEFRIHMSSMHGLFAKSSLKVPESTSVPFLSCPEFSFDVVMDWECESGDPLNHYLHAFPTEGMPREKVYDPFRSLSLSLRWNFSLGVCHPLCDQNAPLNTGDDSPLGKVSNTFLEKLENKEVDLPTVHFGFHDLVWLFKWWNMVYFPPQKLRSFSRWPRFGIPRVPRSGNLSLDKVMTEFCLRIDSTPACVKHLPLRDDDPAKGLTFRMSKLKCELCWSRGKQNFTFDCKREMLDLVYHGIDLHLLKVYVDREMLQSIQKINSIPSSADTEESNGKKCNMTGGIARNPNLGFLLYSDYFIVRRQTPKADGARLLAWQEAGRKKVNQFKYQYGNDSDSDHAESDLSDDDGFNVVIADNCQRLFVYGMKLLWTLENRDVVWSWASGLSKAFEGPKPSASRQHAQMKRIERQKEFDVVGNTQNDTSGTSLPSSTSPTPQDAENAGPHSSPSRSTHADNASSNLLEKYEHSDDMEDEGTGHFMVNVVQPQFNLHSEDANGRFLLAAASGRVLARSFHSVLRLGCEVIEQAIGAQNVKNPEALPELAWKRVELSVMLEHVQAHVAPTDVDPGAGIQWLPKIHRSTQKVKRTGALLERVFMPCQMYFRYTRHKGVTTDVKVKPLKELSFNSPDITASMTSRQFQVMLDVLTNLLFARLPKIQKNFLSYPSEDDDCSEEEAHEVVPYGIEEVEMARVNLEQVEWERKLLLDDIRKLSDGCDPSSDPPESQETAGDLWMVAGEKSNLVQKLKGELGNKQNCRKVASSDLSSAMQKAVQLRLMEREKNKSPYAMRISMRINKVVWSMLEKGKSFAETEINDLVYDFDRDFKDIGLARFTIKAFVVRNSLPNAKSDMLLSAWNAPPEWGKNFMLRVDARQGVPKDGRSPIELFKVDIYPLKIHLTESMYRLMWHYFFPEDEQDPLRRQEVWKVSTTTGSKRGKKGSIASEISTSSFQSIKELDSCERQISARAASVIAAPCQASASKNSSNTTKLVNLKANIPRAPELRRTSSFDKTWEESVAESVANELVLTAHSSKNFPSKSDPLSSSIEQQVNETSKAKTKDAKLVKTGRQTQEEKKDGKYQDEKRIRPRKLTEFRNVKISQVELLLTYEGSRFPVSDLRLLMDTFHREEFIGTWGRLFSRVKKHVIWGVLKSITGMQGKKFKDKSHSQKDVQRSLPAGDPVDLSDSDGGQPIEFDQFPIQFLKRPDDGAGEGFVTSIRGLFNSQRRKAKAFVLRTMRGDEEGELQGEWSEGDAEISPFARQLTITRAKKLIRRHTKKFRPKKPKISDPAFPEQGTRPPSPREAAPFRNDSSDVSSSEELNE